MLPNKKVSLLTIILLCFIYCSSAYCAEPVNYDTLFDADITKSPGILWTIYEDGGPGSAKLSEERLVRAVFVGRYDHFPMSFRLDAYRRLSLYQSPFQVKILFMDYYMKKLIQMGKIDKKNKVYLTINGYKDDYTNLYPQLYKKTKTSKKVSIIPNKLFTIAFFKDEKYIEAYQGMFDAITEAVDISDVDVQKLLPKILDEASQISLTERDKFYFYKVEAIVNEVMLKEGFDVYFDEMKALVSDLQISEIYKLKYFPKMDESPGPVSERIISINIVYDPESDFDYYEMDYAKKCALLYEYFSKEGVSKYKESPLLRRDMVNLVEVQKAFDITYFPTEALFTFEYDSDKDYYDDLVSDFYDDLDDVMEMSEDTISSNDINYEVIKLSATVDEVALKALFKALKEDLKEFRP